MELIWTYVLINVTKQWQPFLNEVELGGNLKQ